MKNKINNSCLSILLLIMTVFMACKKNNFLQQVQNPKPFEKLISLDDLKSLWTGDNKLISNGLFIEAVVVGDPAYTIDGNIYLQDKLGSAIMIKYTGEKSFPVGTKVKVMLSNKELSNTGGAFFLNAIDAVDSLSTGLTAIYPFEGSIEEILEQQHKLHASYIALRDVVIEKIDENPNADIFLVTDEDNHVIKLYVHKGLDLTIPEEANYISGFLSVINGEAFLNIRTQSDIDAVKAPEYLIFKEDFELGKYNQVENFEEELGTGSWHFNQGFAAQSVNDYKNGLRSARISGKATDPNQGYVSPNYDLKGLQSFSFYFSGANFGEGAGNEIPLRTVEAYISKDKGATWVKLAEASAAKNTFTTVTVPVNAGARELVRVKIQNSSPVSTATSNRLRINIDDITFTAISIVK